MKEQNYSGSLLSDVVSLLAGTEYQKFCNAAEKALAILGKHTGADRASIWKNFEQNEEKQYSQLYQWAEQAGEMIAGKREVPIIIGKEQWGFIMLEKSSGALMLDQQTRQEAEAAGLLLASAIIQNQTIKNLTMEKEEAIFGSEAKSRFLANMSHEIRTPLNAIMGMTVIALKSKESEKAEECLQKINNASKHLHRIINDVLDVSKIEAQKFELASAAFDFKKMIYNVQELTAAKAAENNQELLIKIADDIPDRIVTDEVRLTQIITNLLSNAFKFSGKGEAVVLEVKLIEETENSIQLKVTVTDHGIGITEKQRHRLFREFEQADKGIAAAYGGTGLGLAISKNIVELMEGHISVESEPGKGSIFTFDIWVDKTQSNNMDTYDEYMAEPEQEDLSNYTFLVVEDIEVNREIIIEFLKNTGVTCESAENGQEAVEKVKANPGKYDLILMDVLMPIMDGKQATIKIRELETDGRVQHKAPIIALTASAFTEDVEECLRSGMDDHIAKPIEYREFMSKIIKNLKR